MLDFRLLTENIIILSGLIGLPSTILHTNDAVVVVGQCDEESIKQSSMFIDSSPCVRCARKRTRTLRPSNGFRRLRSPGLDVARPMRTGRVARSIHPRSGVRCD